MSSSPAVLSSTTPRTATPATTPTTVTSTSRQIAQLQQSLSLLASTRINASNTASTLRSRTQHLATLTSPASETSASLTQASANLTSILALLRDAREKFDTVHDCEPSIERLYTGAQEIVALNRRRDHPSYTFHVPNSNDNDHYYLNIVDNNATGNTAVDTAVDTAVAMSAAMNPTLTSNDRSILELTQQQSNKRIYNDDDTYTNTATLNDMTIIGLTEQDVYAAADSLEIIRDAYTFFTARPKWKSSPSQIGNLERVHQLGVDAMCILIHNHLINAGPAIRIKRIMNINTFNLRDDGSTIQTRGDSTIATNTTFGTNLNNSKTAITNANTANANTNPNNNNNQINSIFTHQMESASDTRKRLSDALQNRDLMKSVGEYEEHLPLDTRTVRELRAMYECLTGYNCFLQNSKKIPSSNDILSILQQYQTAASKVTRTEKIGSGFYTKLTKEPLVTSFVHLDAYSEARRKVAFQSIQQYYRTLRTQRKKEFDRKQGTIIPKDEHLDSTIESDDIDYAARDAVRCLEHAMVIVAGEKAIYRCVISPTSSHTHDTTTIPLEYKYALVASYSHVCACVVDRVLDIIELFFVKDAGIHSIKANNSNNNNNATNSISTTDVSGMSKNASGGNAGEGRGGLSGVGISNKTLSIPSVNLVDDNENDFTKNGDDDSMANNNNIPSVRFAASAAAASLRILDGVRMLGPSLASLMNLNKRPDTAATGILSTSGKDLTTTSLASNLCICIHRSTVKSCAKALENLAYAVKHNPLDGKESRPNDARVAAVSSDVVRAIRLVSQFVNAYNSVTKRRSLTWDTNIGESAGEMELFIRYLVMSLLSNLQNKAKRYVKDEKEPKAKSQIKAYLFILNNTFYLNEQLGENSTKAPILRNENDDSDGKHFKITGSWFKKSISEMFEGSLRNYLKYWEKLKLHLTQVPQHELSFVKNDHKTLTLESGRLLKTRFSGFNNDFEKIYEMQKEVTIINPKLRKKLLFDIKSVFLPDYIEFYDMYSQYQFSKKNQEEYLKFPPKKLNSMLGNMFSSY